MGEEFDEELTENVGLDQPAYLTPSGMPHVPASQLPVGPQANTPITPAGKVDEFGLPVQNLV